MDTTQFTYKNSNLYNARGEAVMMEWERDWMKKSADIVCKNGGDILNIGHGLGLVDSYIQEHNPTSHTIIEVHSDVHSYMKKNGWYKRANVIESDWQSVVHKLPTFDGIYFDTWAGTKNDFENGLLSNLTSILKKGGIFSYWNNVNVESNDVNQYCKENNFDIKWIKYELNNIPEKQYANKRTYINPKLDYVLLPIITNLNEPIKYNQTLI